MPICNFFNRQFSNISFATHTLEHSTTGLRKTANWDKNRVEELVTRHFKTGNKHLHAQDVNRGLNHVNPLLATGGYQLTAEHIGFRVPDNLLALIELEVFNNQVFALLLFWYIVKGDYDFKNSFRQTKDVLYLLPLEQCFSTKEMRDVVADKAQVG
jgi:hypothetical protein